MTKASIYKITKPHQRRLCLINKLPETLLVKDASLTFDNLLANSSPALTPKVLIYNYHKILCSMRNINSINDKIFETFEILRKHPLMILSKDDNYGLLQNYLEGYVDGLSLLLNKNIRTEITLWYKKKMDVQTSYYWTGHIPFHFEGKSDKELKTILLDITEEYFRENPNWSKPS